MLLLPKLANWREFDPCKSWAALVPESLLKKIWQVGEEQVTHKQRIFGNDGLTKFWDFVGLNFSLVKTLWSDPLIVLHYIRGQMDGLASEVLYKGDINLTHFFV